MVGSSDDSASSCSSVVRVVDNARFAGTCYKAANWLCAGATQGRGKLDTAHARTLPPKSVWIYPLTPRFRQFLAR